MSFLGDDLNFFLSMKRRAREKTGESLTEKEREVLKSWVHISLWLSQEWPLPRRRVLLFSHSQINFNLWLWFNTTDLILRVQTFCTHPYFYSMTFCCDWEPIWISIFGFKIDSTHLIVGWVWYHSKPPASLVFWAFSVIIVVIESPSEYERGWAARAGGSSGGRSHELLTQSRQSPAPSHRSRESSDQILIRAAVRAGQPDHQLLSPLHKLSHFEQQQQ